MNVLIVLSFCLVAHAAAAAYGPVDTPEVAAAKAFHFAAHAAALGFAEPTRAYYPSLAAKALGVPVTTYSGYLPDTPEVAAARAAHLAAKAAAGAPLEQQYTYSPPLPAAVVDTPEVAAAKAIHFAEYARTLAASAPYLDPFAPAETPEAAAVQAAQLAVRAVIGPYFNYYSNNKYSSQQ